VPPPDDTLVAAPNSALPWLHTCRGPSGLRRQRHSLQSPVIGRAMPAVPRGLVAPGETELLAPELTSFQHTDKAPA